MKVGVPPLHVEDSRLSTTHRRLSRCNHVLGKQKSQGLSTVHRGLIDLRQPSLHYTRETVQAWSRALVWACKCIIFQWANTHLHQLSLAGGHLSTSSPQLVASAKMHMEAFSLMAAGMCNDARSWPRALYPGAALPRAHCETLEKVPPSNALVGYQILGVNAIPVEGYYFSVTLDAPTQFGEKPMERFWWRCIWNCYQLSLC